MIDFMVMEWEKLLNKNRLGNRPQKIESCRSAFNSDHDKIIFSGAFRRLARKTQVHPMAINDHIHNRLTHSLEVSCVGRSLGIEVGLKLQQKNRLPEGASASDIGELVQSACLAHDIGNPPFGHTGEQAIRSWFKSRRNEDLRKPDDEKFFKGMSENEVSDLINFEGNAQGLRVLTKVENHLNNGGMRLTYATLASFIKYPWTSEKLNNLSGSNQKKFGVYASERKVFCEVAEAVGLVRKSEDNSHFSPHPLMHLMEAADDFCYGILDLEDGLEMGIVSWQEIYEILKPVIPKEELFEIEQDFLGVSEGRKISILRGKIFDQYIENAAQKFIDHEEDFLKGSGLKLIDLCDETVRDSIKAAKKLAEKKIYNYPRKAELEIGSYNVLSILLEVMSEAAFSWISGLEVKSFRSERVLDLIGEHTFQLPDVSGMDSDGLSKEYLVMMRVLDFISGMTDNYAVFLAKRFSGM